MNTETLKEEIHQIVDKLPEETLLDLWNYVRKVSETSSLSKEQNQLLKKIIQEDWKLLEKLAK